MSAPLFSVGKNKSYGAVTSGTDTLTPTGSNRVLYAISFIDAGGSATQISTATFNSVSLTRLNGWTSGGGRNVEIWRLIAPATGSNTFSWTSSSSGNVWWTLLAYQDADQTTPEHNLDKQITGTSDNLGDITITSATGETVIAYVMSSTGGGDAITSVGGGQTLRLGGSGGPLPGVSDKAGAASVAQNFVRAVGDFWITAGFSLFPVSAVAAFFASCMCLSAPAQAYQPLDTSAGMPRTLQATVAYAPVIPAPHLPPVQMRWQPLDTSQGTAKVLTPDATPPIRGSTSTFVQPPGAVADTTQDIPLTLRQATPAPFNGLSFVSTPWTWYQPLDTSRGIYKGLYGDAVPPFRGSTGVPTPSVNTVADTTQDMPPTLRQVIPLPVASPESPPTPSTAFAPDDTSQSIPIALRTATPPAPPGFSAGYVATPFGLWQPLNTSYSTNPNLLPPDATVPPVIVVSPGAGHAKKVLRDRQERELFELLVHQKREQLKALAAQQKAAEVAVATARKPKAQARAEEKLGEIIARNDAALAEYEALVQQMAYQRWIDEDDDDIMQIMNLL